MLEHHERRAQTSSEQAASFPLTVRRVLHSSATGRVTSDRMKVMIINSGTTTIRHQHGELDLVGGQVALLAPGQWYAGDPAGLVVTTTAYIDTDLLQGQARWIPSSSAPARLLSSDEHRSDPMVIELPSRALSHLNSSFRLLLESQRSQAPALRKLSLVGA